MMMPCIADICCAPAAAASASAAFLDPHCSRSSVLDGAKRQQVINALAQHVFLVPASQVRHCTTLLRTPRQLLQPNAQQLSHLAALPVATFIKDDCY
jgi:hypothetical protein